MAKFIISTTGTLDPVIFYDLGYREFYTASTVNYDLTSEFTLNQIQASKSVQLAIDNGYITATDGLGNNIANPTVINSVVVSQGANIYISGDTFNPTVCLKSNINVNSISANTITSGSTNLYNIFAGIGTGGEGSSTLIQPGSNITTGGTAASPSINLIASPSINGLTTSGLTTIKANFTVTGNTTLNTLTANTLSASTYLGNGGNLTGITGAFGITIDGSGNVIRCGQKGFIIIPYNCAILSWSIIGNASGNCAVDLWKSASVPTSANTITGTQKPILHCQQVNFSSSVSTWTTGLTANDIIAFNVISAETVTKVTVTIKTMKN